MSQEQSKARRKAVALVAAAFVLCPSAAHAHDPGLSSLELRLERDRILATLSVAAADVRSAPGANADADADADPVARLAVDAIELRRGGARLPSVIERSSSDSVTGSTVVLRFEGATGMAITVHSSVCQRLAFGHRQLLVVRNADGRTLFERILDARHGALEIDSDSDAHGSAPATQFFTLGVRHILGGYDHLLFLAALLLGVGRLGQVVRTVTAFTVAHSLTLALAVLGLVSIPSRIVEPLIAASIVFVGIENLTRGQVDSRWKLTFAFGLIHGFGFAAALQELGIGGRTVEIARALASFNLGVEAGQIAVAMVLWPLAKRLNQRPVLNWRLSPACSMLVVAAGMYWLVERIVIR